MENQVKQLVKVQYVHRGTKYYEMTEECSKKFMEEYRKGGFKNWFDVFGNNTSITSLRKEPKGNEIRGEHFEEWVDFDDVGGNEGYSIDITSIESEFENPDGVDEISKWYGTPKWIGERKNGLRVGKWTLYDYKDYTSSKPLISVSYNQNGEVIKGSQQSYNDEIS